MPTRILIIDDFKDSGEVLALGLIDCGFDAVEADSADGAFAIMDDFQPEVILCDLNMPIKDGPALASQLRRNQAWDDVALVAYSSAYVEGTQKQRAADAGFTTLLAMPTPITALCAECERALLEAGVTRYLRQVAESVSN